jgi:hypothetical protein
MTSNHLEQIDAALLCVAEARERAERAAQGLRRDGCHDELASILETADKNLFVLHGEIMRAAYFGSATSEAQLELASAP